VEDKLRGKDLSEKTQEHNTIRVIQSEKDPNSSINYL